ncbi:MAG: bifunctional DNA primase/polymerase, partial [Phycisphaerae bacterium]
MPETADNLLATALAYRQAELSVLPAVAAEKRPALRSWKPYQERLPTEDELRTWFAGADALCLVTGAASGHLEMLDFDGGGALYGPWTDLVRDEAPGLLERLVIERSPSGGYHVAYRCEEPIPGNQKLAQRLADGKPVTLIETRGEGGLFLCDPTPGYTLQQGRFTDLPALMAAERDVLIKAARALNEVAAEPQSAPVGSQPCGRPGDEFNERGDVRALLTRHGWTYVKTVGQNQYWRRPGKDHGWSATLKDRVFYVFTPSAPPFEQDESYSAFRVYALLEHGGDFEAAARALRADGYGAEPDTGDVDLSYILAAADPEPQVGPEDPGPVPEYLFDVPGLIRAVMDFTLARAPYPNVPLAFCGAVTLESYLAGRKVCTPGDLRPNL